MKEIKEQRTPLRADLPKLLSQLETPPEEFTPVPFWFFNDRPDEERIRKQLADYKEKGVDAIVLHPRIGIPQELAYLSEDYFQAVRFIVRCADGLGMKIVLYDEGMYPSGSAHGMVVAENPEYASKGITLSERPETGAFLLPSPSHRFGNKESHRKSPQGVPCGRYE